MTQDTKDLKLDLAACPFCGASAEYVYDDSGVEELSHGIRCTGKDECALQFVFCSTKEKAVSLWNRRVTQAIRLITKTDLDKAYEAFNKKFWEIHKSKSDYVFTDDDYRKMLKCALLTFVRSK